MEKLSLKDVAIDGKTVLMRVDFNIPLDAAGNISDATKIDESLPSIKYVIENGGKLILMSHLGRPEGKVDPQYSLSPCAKYLSQALKTHVIQAPDCLGSEVEMMARRLQTGQVLLLENLRFYAAEENPKSDPLFAKYLANLGDLYVNDAFGTAHRKHSSTYTIAQYFPKRAVAGFLMQKEIQALTELIESPEKPFYAIIGGSKISTKIKVLESLSRRVSAFFIGGGMSYTFLKAQGIAIGDSIIEDDLIDVALKFLKDCSQASIPVFLPVDLVIAKDFSATSTQLIQCSAGIPKGWQGMDTGPETCQVWSQKLSNAKTIFWNGPLGVYEIEPFSKGTYHIAKAISAAHPIHSIVGGGDSVAAIKHLGLGNTFSHLSTGGGASMEFIELGTLPGIEALSNKS